MRTLSNFSDLERLLIEKRIEYEISVLPHEDIYSNAYWVEDKLHMVVSPSFCSWKNVLKPALSCLKERNLIRDFSIQETEFLSGFRLVEFAIVSE